MPPGRRAGFPGWKSNCPLSIKTALKGAVFYALFGEQNA